MDNDISDLKKSLFVAKLDKKYHTTQLSFCLAKIKLCETRIKELNKMNGKCYDGRT